MNIAKLIKYGDTLSFSMVDLATMLWSAALIMQQLCLYFEISIPTKYWDMMVPP